MTTLYTGTAITMPAAKEAGKPRDVTAWYISIYKIYKEPSVINRDFSNGAFRPISGGIMNQLYFFIVYRRLSFHKQSLTVHNKKV